jgi:uncharacterized protein YkwD
MKVAALGIALVVALSWGNARSSPTAEGYLASSINREHARVCGTTLASDGRLVSMARYRAVDMLANDYFAHADPWTGRRFWHYLRTVGIGYSASAEILAWNNYPNDLAAAVAYEGFMDSDGHRAAIRSCTYTRYGVGSYKANGKRMFVVLFIRP